MNDLGGTAPVDGSIVALSRVEARVESHDWAFSRERAPEIAAHCECYGSCSDLMADVYGTPW